MNIKISLVILSIVLLFNGYESVEAETLLLKYDFSDGSKLPSTKHPGVYAGNEFKVYNTTAIPLQMILEEGVDYLSVKNNAMAVDAKRYGYISIAAGNGYNIMISRVEVVSRKGNSNTQNARCYLYGDLNSSSILTNMIYSGSNAGYSIPVDWERISFEPLDGMYHLTDTVYFSFTSTQVNSNSVASDWQLDELAFYGYVNGGTEQIVNDVDISLDALNPLHVISPLMNGSHFVYGNEADNIYKDERVTTWMRDSKAGIIRWPGGTVVMSYHWDNLTGDNFGPDRWDTNNYVEKNIPASAYMDLDEFIAYCRKVNAEPMVGVNILSGKLFRTNKDGLDEATRLIQYCVDNNYQVKHWYIGNEAFAKGFTPLEYANYIDMYATALKKVDPNIVIIGDWQFGPETKDNYNKMLNIIKNSNHLDVMEIHEKWGTIWGLESGSTLDDWKNEFPAFNGKINYYAKKFFDDVKKLGKETKLAFNEWGLGAMENGNEYQYALLVADLMTDMYKNDIYSACYWNLNIGNEIKSRIFRVNNSTKTVEKFNPISKVFLQYAPTLGNNYVGLNSNNQQVYGFASLNVEKDTIQIMLLNKSPDNSRIHIKTNGFAYDKMIQVEWFDEMGFSKTEIVDIADSAYVLPAYSFARIQLTGKVTTDIGKLNPIENKINIHKVNETELKVLFSDNKQERQLRLYDIWGRLTQEMLSSGNVVSFNVAGIKSGAYIMHIKDKASSYVKKLFL